MTTSPRFLLTLGSVLLLIGWTLPLLILLQVIPSTFVVNFVAWIASVSGLFLGFLGGAMLAKMNKE